MRIAFLVHCFPKLSEQFILNQITGLIDRGHDVEIFATLPGSDVKLHPDVEKYQLMDRTHFRYETCGRRGRRVLKGMALFAANVGAHPSPLVGALNILKHGRSALSLDLLFAATQLLRRPPFEIVHCHFGPAGLLAARLRRIGALTGKLVTTFYGCDVSEYLRAHGSEAYRLLIEEGDLFICITDAMRDRLIASGFPPDRIAKVPVGIHLSMFTPRSRRVRPREAIRLLTVARLVEKKGLETSIKAVAAVARSHPNLTYRIVGDGPLRGQLELLIASLRVEKWVELVGWRTQEQVRDEFDRSHIFVLASQTAPNGDEEGLPGVLKEAQAMGLPIVSTLHSGIPEGVLDGRSGFLVPERDVEAFADRLRYLIEHPERWPEMGRAGREFMEQHADIEKLNDLLVRTYEGLFAAAAA